MCITRDPNDMHPLAIGCRCLTACGVASRILSRSVDASGKAREWGGDGTFSVTRAPLDSWELVHTVHTLAR